MPKYKTFHVCINIFIYHYYGETKIFKIKHPITQFFLASFYNFTSVILGIWRVPFISDFGNTKYVIRAIKINSSGGTDYTKLHLDSFFDEKTNYVWMNLSRTVKQELDRNQVIIILQEQDIFSSKNEELFNYANIQYLVSKLNCGPVNTFSERNIKSVLQVLELYENADFLN